MIKMKYRWEVTPDIYIGDDTYRRFVLGVSGSDPLICFGVNPSTANNEYADKTLHMVEQIAKRNGFDGWIMFNVCPFRAIDPKCLPRIQNDDLHKENLRYIEKCLEKENLTIWAAWGDPIMEREYLIDYLYDIYGIANRYNPRTAFQIPMYLVQNQHHAQICPGEQKDIKMKKIVEDLES